MVAAVWSAAEVRQRGSTVDTAGVGQPVGQGPAAMTDRMVRLGRVTVESGGGWWAGGRRHGSRWLEVVEEAAAGEGMLRKKKRNKWV